MNDEYRKILYRDASFAFESVMRAPWVRRWQLWHMPGRLELQPAGQDVDHMIPVPGSTEIPWCGMTAAQFTARIDEMARSLPILTE